MNLARLPTSTLLVRRLAAGETDARALFAQRYRDPLLAFAQIRGLPSDDLEAAVHDTLRLAAELLPQGRYDPAKGRFRDWLVGILRNRLRTTRRADAARLRRERRYAADLLLDTLPDPAPLSDAALWRKLCLRHAIRLLLNDPAWQNRTRAVFVAYVLRQRPAPEVAAAYGLTPNAVHQIKARGIARLRALMRDMR